ncbi:unnamed protein product [Camellia sinensis]
MKLLVWNCRGAGGATTVHTICELVRAHDPAVLVLLETRVQSLKANRILRRIRFSAMATVEALGFVGGIWLLWRTDLVNVEVLPPHSQALSAVIRRCNEVDWLFTAIYASLCAHSRTELWDYLAGVAHGLSLPWLVAGDFDQIMAHSEKQGGASSSHRQLIMFWDNINRCHLLDLGFSRSKFTWTNGRKRVANIKKRIDRALCTDSWRHLFPEAWVQHLPMINSDHCPLLISLFGTIPQHSKRPFRIEAAWLTHPTFKDSLGIFSGERTRFWLD